MGKTIAQKIIASHLVSGDMTPGSEIALRIDQTLTQDAGREQQARENNISTGKAALVNRVLALNSTLKFDELAKLSVELIGNVSDGIIFFGRFGIPKSLAGFPPSFHAGTAD